MYCHSSIQGKTPLMESLLQEKKHELFVQSPAVLLDSRHLHPRISTNKGQFSISLQ
ncbi:hypothetical protein AM1_5214 [Acaryochloris marina MBIC11017]|uniref:Uncharacterized protein n=1 Tax=Acaryochloris marina (strain MBIC 11017) TaxID=329726 RepID=B0C9M8_ACAM1|nr:hypothetical protein AM1_5214 [Acaryochloris marina MBIC11017]